MKISDWTLLKDIDKAFAKTVKMFSIHGVNRETAFMVTNEDKFFSFGSNENGWLGIGSLTPNQTFTPVRVDALCGKKIASVSTGSDSHVVALSKNGEVYSWGENDCGELGVGNTTNSSIPVLVEGQLQSRKIKEISCGGCHTLALSNEGEVFAWGMNAYGQIGCNNKIDQSTPLKVVGLSQKMKAVACGYAFSIALSEAGEIFSWGHFLGGAGGHTKNIIPLATKINLEFSIAKIVCGLWHTLALSSDGALCSWGYNQNGQLCNGNTDSVFTPTRVLHSLENGGNINDIAAYGNISVVRIDSNVYMRGQCSNESVVVARKTNYESMMDVFRFHSSPQVTYKSVKLESTEEESTIKACLMQGFDNPEYSDVQFFVEGNVIHAHTQILRMRLEYFRTMFSGRWEKKDDGNYNKSDDIQTMTTSKNQCREMVPASPQVQIVEIASNIRYKVFYAFLYYLYTDILELPHKDFCDLLEVADFYGETNLRMYCAQCLKKSITAENAAELYLFASLHNAKELEEFSLQYIVNNFKAVVLSDSYKKLDKNAMLKIQDAFARK